MDYGGGEMYGAGGGGPWVGLFHFILFPLFHSHLTSCPGLSTPVRAFPCPSLTSKRWNSTQANGQPQAHATASTTTPASHCHSRTGCAALYGTHVRTLGASPDNDVLYKDPPIVICLTHALLSPLAWCPVCPMPRLQFPKLPSALPRIPASHPQPRIYSSFVVLAPPLDLDRASDVASALGCHVPYRWPTRITPVTVAKFFFFIFFYYSSYFLLFTSILFFLVDHYRQLKVMVSCRFGTDK